MNKLLKISSIVYIVLAAIGIVTGIVTAVGGGVAMGATDEAALAIGAVGMAVGITVALSNVWGIVCGIVGVNASKGGRKALIATVVLAAISIISSLYSMISFAVSTGVFPWFLLTGLVLPVIMIIPAIMILKDAKKL